MFANERGSVRLLLGVFSLHNWEEVSHLPQDLENLPPGPGGEVRGKIGFLSLRQLLC